MVRNRSDVERPQECDYGIEQAKHVFGSRASPVWVASHVVLPGATHFLGLVIINATEPLLLNLESAVQVGPAVVSRAFLESPEKPSQDKPGDCHEDPNTVRDQWGCVYDGANERRDGQERGQVLPPHLAPVAPVDADFLVLVEQKLVPPVLVAHGPSVAGSVPGRGAMFRDRPQLEAGLFFARASALKFYKKYSDLIGVFFWSG